MDSKLMTEVCIDLNLFYLHSKQMVGVMLKLPMGCKCVSKRFNVPDTGYKLQD